MLRRLLSRRSSSTPPRVVVITGGASGIGRALAARYAEAGTTLVLLDRSPLDEVAAELRDRAAADVRTATVDVTDPAALATTVDELCDGLRVDRAIHCAGVLPAPRAVASTDPDVFARTHAINVGGTLHFAKAVIPHLAPGAHLALIASLGGLVAGYHYAAYSSSKFAVVGLAESLRMELAPQGIRTQVICPGEVTTPLLDEELADLDAVARQIKLLSGDPITADRAADLIHRGIEGGDFFVIPTARAKQLWLVTRFAPTPIRHAIADREIRRAHTAAAT